MTTGVMETVRKELREQYRATLDMLTLAVEHCPEELWARVFGDDSPFWKEAYHAVFWLKNFAGGPSKSFERTPFGRDIDPRLFAKPEGAVTRDVLLGFIAATLRHIDVVFEQLTTEQLGAEDGFGDGFRSVYHRLLYGLRHGQHHTGKLTGYLFSCGIDYDPWRG